MKNSKDIILGTVIVRAENPHANELLKSANKWLRRLEERRAELPKSFFRDGDPVPLRKQITAFLSGKGTT